MGNEMEDKELKEKLPWDNTIIETARDLGDNRNERKRKEKREIR